MSPSLRSALPEAFSARAFGLETFVIGGFAGRFLHRALGLTSRTHDFVLNAAFHIPGILRPF